MRKQRGMGFGGIFLICALIVFGSVGASTPHAAT